MTDIARDTCPRCGRHPRELESVPSWIEHLQTCTGPPTNGKKAA